MGSNRAGCGLVEVSRTEAGESSLISNAIVLRKFTALQPLVHTLCSKVRMEFVPVWHAIYDR
jgi:hypothetical protein